MDNLANRNDPVAHGSIHNCASCERWNQTHPCPKCGDSSMSLPLVVCWPCHRANGSTIVGFPAEWARDRDARTFGLLGVPPVLCKSCDSLGCHSFGCPDNVFEAGVHRGFKSVPKPFDFPVCRF